MVNRFLRLQYYSSPFSCKFTSVQFLAKSSTLRPRKVLIRLSPLSMLHPASPCSCGYEVATSEETNVTITRLRRNESVGVRLVTGVICSLQSLGMAWHVKIDDDDDDSTPSNRESGINWMFLDV
jgi:hypothetical protein